MVATGGTPAPGAEPLPRLARLGQLLDDWAADAEAAHEAYTTGTPRGPVTGLKRLDSELGGWLAPGLHVVHGGPGVGKTAFGLQLAATCGFPALYITCEMKPLELFRRITAQVTGKYLGRLRSGELAPAESLSLARRAAAEAKGVGIADATQAGASVDWLAEAAAIVRGAEPHLLIVVDSVHSWAEGIIPDTPEYDRLNLALARLRALASEQACPVLVIAERNRASMTSGGISASAGSRKFEYGGESVLDLTREKETPPDAHGEVGVELIIWKNRNGSPGARIPLRFHGALQRWREA